MATSMDFSYFSSAPLPYQFASTSHQPPETELQFDDYSHVQSTESFPQPYAQFQDPFQYEAPVVNTHHHARTPSILNHASISPGLEESSYLLDDGNRPRSSSEEKDGANPQQNKRKAQNRAAQRAFRERKEKHLKDLETQLANLQQQSVSLDSENERLRKELAKVATENEILRATTSGSADDDSFRGNADNDTDSARRIEFGPLRTVVIDDSSGEPLLNAGQTWDYIQAHEMFRKGLVDVGDVCERLKRLARCHGQGPVFRECDIRRAIDKSAVAGGRDELI